MYAVIETGGKQYRVQQGDVISVEKLKVASGEKVTFDRVLIVNDGKGVTVGTPVVENAAVTGTVIENGKGEKVIIFKYKAKKDYRKKQGHRQPYTMIQIDEVTLDGKVLVAEKVEEEKAAEKKPAKAEKKPAAKKKAAEKKEEVPAEAEVEVKAEEAAPAEAEVEVKAEEAAPAEAEAEKAEE